MTKFFENWGVFIIMNFPFVTRSLKFRELANQFGIEVDEIASYLRTHLAEIAEMGSYEDLSSFVTLLRNFSTYQTEFPVLIFWLMPETPRLAYRLCVDTEQETLPPVTGGSFAKLADHARNGVEYSVLWNLYRLDIKPQSRALRLSPNQLASTLMLLTWFWLYDSERLSELIKLFPELGRHMILRRGFEEIEAFDDFGDPEVSERFEFWFWLQLFPRRVAIQEMCRLPYGYCLLSHNLDQIESDVEELVKYRFSVLKEAMRSAIELPFIQSTLTKIVVEGAGGWKRYLVGFDQEKATLFQLLLEPRFYQLFDQLGMDRLSQVKMERGEEFEDLRSRERDWLRSRNQLQMVAETVSEMASEDSTQDLALAVTSLLNQQLDLEYRRHQIETKQIVLPIKWFALLRPNA